MSDLKQSESQKPQKTPILSEEFNIRSQKLEDIRLQGVDPYPHVFKPSGRAVDLHHLFEGQPVGNHEEALEKKTPSYKLAGRLVLFRAMGKNAFAQIQDGTDKIQVMFSRDITKIPALPTEENPLKWIEKKIDLGDWIGLQGHLFRTQKGELTLLVEEATLLSKSLHPLPDKHAGLSDKETRYRKRWLDLIANEDVKKSFELRSKILRTIRDFFFEKGYMEVETPVLQSIYGGAEARPFTTTLNALDQEMFLRISLEPSLKKLIVGGYEKVFEIGKVFRNEGLSTRHNPEFTLLEAYAAYNDYNDMMVLVETLYERLALETFGTTEVPARLPGSDEVIYLQMKAPWKRMTMKEAVKTYGGIDVDTKTEEELRAILLKTEHVDKEKVKGLSKGLLTGVLFEVFGEPHLIQPHHIIDHPIETTPFSKLHRDPVEKANGIVERFESFIMKTEGANSYTELNDPVLQKKLLLDQAHRKEKGDAEAAPYDEDFVEAIEQGMPPTGGVGIGIDRLVMLFTEAQSIRDVLFFPWMK